jgi:lipoate-protein ligase A
MKPHLRILDTGLRPARWNVAMTAALAELHAGRRAPDTVRFHRYPACVLVGRSQDAATAADLGWCRRQGIEIARRVTGGGAVFMSPRMLAWDVVVDRRAFGGGLDAVTQSLCRGVAAGLSRLGAAAHFRAPNDIEIGGRKVSGSSGYSEGNGVVLQGTVLTGDDTRAMAQALRIPEPVLRDKVTCLEAVLAEVPSPASIISRIAQGIAEALGREPAAGCLGADETALCEALLRAEIGTEAFVSGAVAAEGATA